jgi:hypothetical protein
MKTIKFLITGFILISLAGNLHAQPRGRMDGERREKVEAMKIAFITKRLDLTSEEAQKFWPVYNQMSKDLETLRKNRRGDIRDAREDFDSLSEKDLEKIVDNEIIFRQSELDVMKKYHSQFKQVLPIKKVALLYKTEDDFKRFLINEIRNKGENRMKN